MKSDNDLISVSLTNSYTSHPSLVTVFLIYNFPIPEQYFFPAPGEGVGAEGFVEGAVGIAVHFFLCQGRDPMLMDFRKRGGEGF